MEIINLTIWLTYLSLSPTSSHGCFHRVPMDQFDFIVGLGNWSDKSDRIYYTAVILKIDNLYIIAANAEILTSYKSFSHIKLMKWPSEGKMVRGTVEAVTQRNAFLLIRPEPGFINTNHYVKFHSKSKPKVMRLYIIQSYSPTDMSLTNLAVHPSEQCTTKDLPVLKYQFYWDNYQFNEVSCYRSILGIKTSCVLDRGFVVLSNSFKHIYGIGLPYPEMRCYRRVYARELWHLNITDIQPSVTNTTSAGAIIVSDYFMTVVLLIFASIVEANYGNTTRG